MEVDGSTTVPTITLTLLLVVVVEAVTCISAVERLPELALSSKEAEDAEEVEEVVNVMVVVNILGGARVGLVLFWLPEWQLVQMGRGAVVDNTSLVDVMPAEDVVGSLVVVVVVLVGRESGSVHQTVEKTPTAASEHADPQPSNRAIAPEYMFLIEQGFTPRTPDMLVEANPSGKRAVSDWATLLPKASICSGPAVRTTSGIMISPFLSVLGYAQNPRAGGGGVVVNSLRAT